MTQAARLDQKASDLRGCSRRLKAAAGPSISVLSATQSLTGPTTWNGPFATEATAQIESWRQGTTRSADAMMGTASRWDRAAAGFSEQAANVRRQAGIAQRAADQAAAQKPR